MDHGVYGGEESESRTMCRGYNLSEYYVQIDLMPMVTIQVLITAVVQAYESDLTEGKFEDILEVEASLKCKKLIKSHRNACKGCGVDG